MLLVPPFFFFVFLSVLFSFVYMVATHKKMLCTFETLEDGDFIL